MRLAGGERPGPAGSLQGSSRARCRCRRPSRRAFLLGAASALAGSTAIVPAAPDAQERQPLRLGLALDATGWLPLYVAADHTAVEEGLWLELVSFNGDAGVGQALASDSVQVAISSLSGLLQMISAGLAVKGFYAGFHQAGWEWFGQPEVPGLTSGARRWPSRASPASPTC